MLKEDWQGGSEIGWRVKWGPLLSCRLPCRISPSTTCTPLNRTMRPVLIGHSLALENPKSRNNLHHRLWEKNLNVGSSKLVDIDFLISANGSSRCVDARTSDAQNLETPKGFAS
jgi:hypothetical protein